MKSVESMEEIFEAAGVDKLVIKHWNNESSPVLWEDLLINIQCFEMNTDKGTNVVEINDEIFVA